MIAPDPAAKDDMEPENPTEARIWAAADRLVERGENVTYARVRDEVGGGSNVTIGKYLATWREARAEEAALREELALPSLSDEAKGRVLELAEQIQSAIEEEAGKLLSEERKAAAANLAEAKDHLETAETARQAAEERAEGLAERLETAEQRIREMEAQVAAEAARRKEAENQINGAITARDNAARALEQARSDYQNALASERERNEANERRLLLQIDEAKQALKRAEQEHAQREATWVQARQRLEAALEERVRAVRDLSDAKAALERDLAVTRERAEQLATKATDLDQQCQQAQQEKRAIETTVAELERDLLRTSTDLQAATQERDRLTHEVDRLMELISATMKESKESKESKT